MSNLGFATQKEAIWALDDDGLDSEQIAERLGIKKGTVYARLSDKRKAHADLLPPEMAVKVQRIHEAALAVIAEGCGVTLAQVIRALSLEVKPKPPVVIEAEHGDSSTQALPALPSLRAPAAKTAPAPVVPPPAPTQKAGPVKPERIAPARRFGLKTMDGKWLTKDGKGFSVDPAEAWTGDANQVKDARQRFVNARFCKPRELGDG